jgi:hypothetical protein
LKTDKRCGACKQTLSKTEFYGDKRRIDGLQSRCKSCNVMVTHGITRNDYERMMEQQQGRCAICGSKESKKGKTDAFQVDHNHYSGNVRGLLCFECNIGLGKFKDSPEMLKRAAEYLVVHN